MDTLSCFISLFRLDDTLPFVQIPNGNKHFCILMCAIFLFFIAGSTSRRNKGNLKFQLVARAKQMRLPYLLGSPTLSRETKMPAALFGRVAYLYTLPIVFPIQSIHYLFKYPRSYRLNKHVSCPLGRFLQPTSKYVVAIRT